MKRAVAKYHFPRHVGPAAWVRLAQLKIPSKAIMMAEQAAGYARRNYGSDLVMSAAAGGVIGYHEGTGALRRVFKQYGWHWIRTDSLNLTISPDFSIAILIAAGDEYTGRDIPVDPRTWSAKGKSMLRYILNNRALVGVLPMMPSGLFEQRTEEEADPNGADDDLPELWILLMATDERGGGLELSMPLGMLHGNNLVGFERSKVSEFGERLIFRDCSIASIKSGKAATAKAKADMVSAKAEMKVTRAAMKKAKSAGRDVVAANVEKVDVVQVKQSKKVDIDIE